MKIKNDYFLVLITLIFTMTFVSKAKAEGYNFNFENDVQGKYLDPFVLDTYGENAPIPVGQTWKSRGVIISTKNTDKPVGLFQSSCIPENGFSLTAKEVSCKQQSYGNNGLATGEGKYLTKSTYKNNVINYKTEPQGNILIIEENPGNGIPEDSPHGGTIKFDFDRTILSSVEVSKIGIVDHAQGSIVVKYMNGEEYIREINHKYRNQLEFYDIPEGEVEYIEVNFKGNGGVTGVEFEKLMALGIPSGVAVATLPSFTIPSVVAGGLGVFGLLGGGNSHDVEIFEPYFADNNKKQTLFTENEDISRNLANSIVNITDKNNSNSDNSISFLSPQNTENESNLQHSGLNINKESNSSSISSNNSDQVREDVVVVPESSTIIATLVALGLGKIIKKKSAPN